MARNSQCTARRPQVWLVALAAMALAACAPSTGASTAPVPTLTPVISMSTPTPVPVDTGGDARHHRHGDRASAGDRHRGAARTGEPVAQHVTASGPFQSPSGNILCNMATYSTGGITTRCEVPTTTGSQRNRRTASRIGATGSGWSRVPPLCSGATARRCPPPRTPSNTARFRRSARSVATARRSESCASTTRPGTTSSCRARPFSSAEAHDRSGARPRETTAAAGCHRTHPPKYFRRRHQTTWPIEHPNHPLDASVTTVSISAADTTQST